MELNAVNIILVTLASARITRFVMHDTTGSFVRSAIRWIWPSRHQQYADELLECPWCVGFWISLSAVALAQWEYGLLALIPWAISYAVGILEGEWF